MFGKLKGYFAGDKNSIAVLAPLQGQLKPITEVNDSTFSEEILGSGVAIVPGSNRVVSPVSGSVTQMFHTGHAVSLLSDDGVEVLVHIGLDTIRLKGRHFTTHVKDGDRVQAGDLLIEFDREAIAAEGFDVTSPVVICNTAHFKQIVPVAAGPVQERDAIMHIKK